VRLALIYPPACDPTAPYPALASLAGFLRPHGIDVLPIDANLEAFNGLLRREPLMALGERIAQDLASLQRRRALDHQEQLHLLTLLRARGEAEQVPEHIEQAVKVLRSRELFYDGQAYAAAVSTVDAALRVVSAAHAPLQLDFTAYRTPFALTSPEEIARDAQPERDAFDRYLASVLIPQLRAARPDAIGLSVCFPGQLVPAYSFALKLKRAFPEVHLVAGGPAITQILLRLQGSRLATALGAFDSAVVFEGEHTLLALCRALDERRALRDIPHLVTRDPLLGARWLPGTPTLDLRGLPAPDFDGLPLGEYLSPHLLLPYDPTRGCYWGRCAFCHYGLTASGTARYRERPVDTIIEHLGQLSRRHHTRYFYFSQDSVAPKTLVKLAEGLAAAGLDLRWGTDLRPEPSLTPARCRTLRKGGALACSLGIESASARVLGLINKGIKPEAARLVVHNLARAGIAAELMCFTDFPTESYAEALQTLGFIDELRDDIATFIVGTFDLTHGSAVAREPERFGVREIWSVSGDAMATTLFYRERKLSKTDGQRERLERALDGLACAWSLRRYPWAGSLSTAHTLFHYDRFGPTIFKQRAGLSMPEAPETAPSRFPLAKLAQAEEHEAEIWHELIQNRRTISRQAYEELAATFPKLRPSRVGSRRA
jgi:hypothetical protein